MAFASQPGSLAWPAPGPARRRPGSGGPWSSPGRRAGARPWPGPAGRRGARRRRWPARPRRGPPGGTALVVHGGDAEPADGGMQGQALVADRRGRLGQLLVGPGRLGDCRCCWASASGGRAASRSGCSPAGRPAQPGLDQAGVARTAARCPAAVALAGPPGQLGDPPSGRASWRTDRPRRSGGRRSRRTGCAGPRSTLQPVGVALVELGPAVVGQPLIGHGLDGGVRN